MVHFLIFIHLARITLRCIAARLYLPRISYRHQVNQTNMSLTQPPKRDTQTNKIVVLTSPDRLLNRHPLRANHLHSPVPPPPVVLMMNNNSWHLCRGHKTLQTSRRDAAFQRDDRRVSVKGQMKPAHMPLPSPESSCAPWRQSSLPRMHRFGSTEHRRGSTEHRRRNKIP